MNSSQIDLTGFSLQLDHDLIASQLQRYINIEPSPPAERSTHFACGEQRLRARVDDAEITDETINVLTHHCYELPAGATCELTIEFFEDGQPTFPEGELRLSTERGKLSQQFIELTGHEDKVEDKVMVTYKAPDETIKNSIRAYFPGFTRGKIHLHFV